VSGTARHPRLAPQLGHRVEFVLKLYTLYIHDDRYSVPSLDALSAVDDGAAEGLARARLDGSTHYTAIEVWEEDRQVARVDRA
jgi:hypothetical protein